MAYRNSGIADGFLAIAATPVTPAALAAPGSTITSTSLATTTACWTSATTPPGPLDLPLTRKRICAYVAKRCFHRIWLGRTTDLVVSRTAIVTPILSLPYRVISLISTES